MEPGGAQCDDSAVLFSMLSPILNQIQCQSCLNPPACGALQLSIWCFRIVHNIFVAQGQTGRFAHCGNLYSFLITHAGSSQCWKSHFVPSSGRKELNINSAVSRATLRSWLTFKNVLMSTIDEPNLTRHPCQERRHQSSLLLPAHRSCPCHRPSGHPEAIAAPHLTLLHNCQIRLKQGCNGTELEEPSLPGHNFNRKESQNKA